MSAAACTFLIWKVAWHLQLFGGQDKHGHAADTQGACSQICCGESPRAFGQRVPLGDQKTLTLEPTSKHMLSCGSCALVLCSSKVMPWAFERTPTERGSLFPCLPPADVGQRWHRKSVLTWSFGWWYHVVAFSCCGCKQSSVKATCTPGNTRCDCFYFWRLDSWSSAVEYVSCLYVSDLEGCIAFAAFWGAGQAWPRSGHTGSLLPDMLRGKSPCLWAESATGRPEDLDSGADIEAHAELWFLGFGPLQQQSYAMSVWKNANWTGLTLSMPPSCRCWTVLTWSFGRRCHVVALYSCDCKQSRAKAACTTVTTRSDCFYFWRLDSWSSAI